MLSISCSRCPNLEDLRGQLQRISDVLEQGRSLLFKPDASEWKALSLARWEIGRAIAAYIHYKRHLAVGPLTNMAEILRVHTEFGMRWPLTALVKVDAVYQAEAAMLARQVAVVIRRESAELELAREAELLAA